MSLYVDPDLGLFWHWPVSIPAAALCVVALGLPRLRLLAVSVASFCLLLPFVVSVHPNWNSGGTVHMSRYAVLLIPPLAVVGCLTTAELFRHIPVRLMRLAIAVLLASALGVYAVRWNFIAYSPAQDEVYIARTRYSSWLYEHHPSWYDPVPEVFAERSAFTEDFRAYLKPGGWAIGNLPCTKLLMIRPMEELRTIKEPQNPLGCLTPNDSRILFDDLVAGRRKPTAREYVNVE
jgi:hypothetical protein